MVKYEMMLEKKINLTSLSMPEPSILVIACPGIHLQKHHVIHSKTKGQSLASFPSDHPLSQHLTKHFHLSTLRVVLTL